MLVAIVLGNRLNDDGSLTSYGKQRLGLLKKADELYHFDRIILSGGVANIEARRSEAKAMYCALDPGFQDRCVLEQESLTTMDNASESIPLALNLEADKIVVITSREHMTRWYLNPRRIFKRALRKAHGKVVMEFYC